MERNLWEDFDLVYDERLARRSKRRRHPNAALKVNSFNHSLKRTLREQQLGGRPVDEDYMLFLNHLGDYFESSHLTRKDDDDSGEDDDVDPHYKMFLDRLIEDGKSYVLKVALNDEVSLSLKYEAEGSSDDELEPHRKRKLRSFVDTESLKAAKDFRMKPQFNPMSILGEDMIDSAKNMTNRVGSESTDSMAKDKTSEPLNQHVSGKENVFPSGKDRSTDNHSGKDRSTDNHSFEVDSEHEKEFDMVDECYQIYLNGIKGDADCVLSTIEDAKTVKFEQIDDESSSDSEVLVAYNASDFDNGNYTPFETSKLFVTLMEEDQQSPGNLNRSNHSSFREKLMDKLRESYDHEEYKKLWQDITEQRPKERCFHFRSGVVKSCKKMNELGSSYLEQHLDLKAKIAAVLFDRCKVLNLLRGFFFWLQNLVQQDAFLPWLDTCCLEVTPRKSAKKFGQTHCIF